MPIVRAARSGLVRAPATVVYGLLADYRNGHPRILPTRYFAKLEVERGGTGAGTIIRFQLRVLGATREIRSEITEPTPGRVMVESELATGTRTTFTVTPESGGGTCRVNIETVWEAKGLRGWIERLTAPRFLQRIYVEELALLTAVVEADRGKRAHPPA
jgi:hypothetical protein